MNKKLLFAAMSLAALTACTDNDFENQKLAEEASPVEIELINFNDGMTRASMDGNTIKWSAKEGDLFTLYHGGAGAAVTGFQNATFSAKSTAGEPARLTTPTMILPGEAIMVWPVDTAFNIKSGDNLSISIPAEQKNIENYIPYVSDRFTIANYAKLQNDPNKAGYNEYNSAGKDRKYTIYMRPMASQLNLKADYVGMDDIKALEEDEDPIDPIKLTSVDLSTKTGGNDLFTTKVAIKWNGAVNTNWPSATELPNKSWSDQTELDVANVATTGTQVDKLTSMEECLNGNDGCKFLILPQGTIADGVDEAAIVVKTIYGMVVIQDPTVAGTKTKYDEDEYKAAWYRYLSTKKAADTEENASDATAETAGDNAGKYKTVAKSPALGLQQTINYMSTYTAKSGTVKGEPLGVALTRYVKVNLKHLDMSDLHIKTDKQLRDVVRVWNKLGLDAVTVYLDGGSDDDEDGDAAGEFTISQKTIKTINDINKAKGGIPFKVKPCVIAGEACTEIIVKGGGDVQDVAFIAANGTTKADVVFNEGETWNWKGAVKVDKTGVERFINRGTMVNAEDATIKTTENDGTKNNVPLRNTGTWNITAGKLFVQFSVTNLNAVNIAKGAEYRQDKSTFNNGASAIPTRFGGDDSKIGKVENKGVFATVNDGIINNVGLIEHADKDAKTYITTNQSATVDFANAFKNTPSNKMGTINLPYSNKEEDNISILAAADKGFVSVTVSAADAPADGILNADVVGERVNYINITGGITTIAKVSDQVKYVEINDKDKKEIAWSLTAPATAAYEGLMVLSPVNIKLNTEIQVTKACYLGADMYVGGKFNNGTDGVLPKWNGYFGDTTDNFATMYVTY